jgi:hypothetical protein
MNELSYEISTDEGFDERSTLLNCTKYAKTKR